MTNKEENEKDIEKLVQVTSNIQDLYYKKLQQLEDLKGEISALKEILNVLKSMVSVQSFKRADEIYFQQTLHPDNVKGAKIKRKIFIIDDNQEEKLSAILNIIGMNDITVKFMYPEEASIKESSDKFIRTFIKEALVKIKEKNPDLTVKYEYFKKTNFISAIRILNASTMEDFDLISSKIQELLEK
ncbi:MAG: hypothetical protein ACFFAS_19960 [Promethearchaeota archaeon]